MFAMIKDLLHGITPSKRREIEEKAEEERVNQQYYRNKIENSAFTQQIIEELAEFLIKNPHIVTPYAVYITVRSYQVILSKKPVHVNDSEDQYYKIISFKERGYYDLSSFSNEDKYLCEYIWRKIREKLSPTYTYSSYIKDSIQHRHGIVDSKYEVKHYYFGITDPKPVSKSINQEETSVLSLW